MPQTVLITGANRGIGLEMVRQFAETDARIFATCRIPEAATDLKRLASFNPERVSVHRLDPTKPGQIQDLRRILDGKPVDMLINNAGRYGDNKAFGQTDVDDWVETFRTNTVAPLKMMEAFADAVAASERKLMINLSSKMGSMADNGSGGSYVYRSTKAALNAVVVSAARDLKARGIIVVAMHPGWVLTDMGGAGAEMTVTESVMALRRLMDGLKPADSGRFIDINGADIPW